MANPTYRPHRLTIMLCVDDDQSKSVVANLARDIGFAPVNVGPLGSARCLEAVAMLWIDMFICQGFGIETVALLVTDTMVGNELTVGLSRIRSSLNLMIIRIPARQKHWPVCLAVSCHFGMPLQLF